MSFIIRPEDLRDPFDSAQTEVRIELDPGCDGLVCGNAIEGEDGEPVSCVPHDQHLVISGKDPVASPRRFSL
jgi:hypothetical protein